MSFYFYHWSKKKINVLNSLGGLGLERWICKVTEINSCQNPTAAVQSLSVQHHLAEAIGIDYPNPNFHS